jgi:hypothetical protein
MAETLDRIRTPELTRLLDVLEQSAKQPEPEPGKVIFNEVGFRRRDPSWQLVEAVVRGLVADSVNTFCILECPGGSYMQTLRDTVDLYRLERRICSSDIGAKGYCHEYAASPEGGSLVDLATVLTEFRLFYKSGGAETLNDWRGMDL